MHPENTIAKQIKEPVDKAKERNFKTSPNIAKSFNVNPLECSFCNERSLRFWTTRSASDGGCPLNTFDKFYL